MDVAYVEMIEDFTSGWASPSEVRAAVDAALRDVAPGVVPARPADRHAWLTGTDARDGQAAMLDLVGVARRRGR